MRCSISMQMILGAVCVRLYIYTKNARSRGFETFFLFVVLVFFFPLLVCARGCCEGGPAVLRIGGGITPEGFVL